MRKVIRRSCALAALLLGAVGLTAASLPPGLQDLDATVERARKVFDVPGIAVAIVKDGEVVWAKGYGVKKSGGNDAITADTLFAIASNSKAFTTAALALLADEGELAWDDPVTAHLPGFQMHDAYATQQMTVRDLLTHRSGLGLGAGDLLFWPPTDYPTAEIVRRLRFIRPATSFRASYAYDNILYATAGELIRAVSGLTWQQFVRERIFGPVGMTNSVTDAGDIKPGADVAEPHAKADFKGAPLVIGRCSWSNAAGAGAIYSSVADLAKWVTVQLNGGVIKGADGKETVLFSRAQQSELWRPQSPIPITVPGPLAELKPNFLAYGLGWTLQDFRGHKVVSHTGGFPGYVSTVMMVPDLNVGVIVLTNQEEGGAFRSVAWHVIQAYTGEAKTDLVAAYREVRLGQLQEAEDTAKEQEAKRDAKSKPSLPLGKYAGTYRDGWYGDVSVAEKNGKLAIKFSHTPALVGELEYWQHDTFVARWADRTLNADAFVTFALTPDGGIDRVKMEAMSPLADFSFDFQDLELKPVEN
ncbi:MAG: serine hydrolase [Opitutae bacterium]|nr:serine hydrolase [Opitutae bacterium]